MSTLTNILGHLLFVYMVAGEPLLGARFFRGMHNGVMHDPLSRGKYYIQMIAWDWGLVAALGAVLITESNPLKAVGLGSISPLAGLFILLIIVTEVFSTAITLRNPDGKLAIRARLAPAQTVLPDNWKEERWFTGLALTAGICEELLGRGFVFYYLGKWVPGLTIWEISLISAAIYALAHAYEGRAGIFEAGFSGILYAFFYAISGSLIPGILFHICSDLRSMIFWSHTKDFIPMEASNG